MARFVVDSFKKVRSSSQQRIETSGELANTNLWGFSKAIHSLAKLWGNAKDTGNTRAIFAAVRPNSGRR